MTAERMDAEVKARTLRRLLEAIKDSLFTLTAEEEATIEDAIEMYEEGARPL